LVFRYCSDQCGIDVASLTFAEREQKRVGEALEEAQRVQQRRLSQWTAAHPDVLVECSPSDATRRDLELLGIRTDGPDDVVLTRGENGWSSDKAARRAHVAAGHRILLLVGDDLGDFLSPARQSVADRLALARSREAWWGTRWILLPNPLYGSWESALTDHDRTLDEDEVLRRKLARVRGFASSTQAP
jgi:hypothetical protein